jgi:hypothetical protein
VIYMLMEALVELATDVTYANEQVAASYSVQEEEQMTAALGQGASDPGEVPTTTSDTPEDAPVVEPRSDSEGVSQEDKQPDWMTGPNPEGHVIEVPVYPTPPPPPPTD